MKIILKFSFLLFLFFSNYLLTAQDIISLKNGEKINGKVLEIGLKEIKYKAYNNLDGPIITIKKSSVIEIKYENGTFNIINKPKKDTISKHDTIPHNSFFISPYLHFITVPSKTSPGIGFNFGKNFYGNKSYDLMGLGIDKFNINNKYYYPASNYSVKYLSIYFTNKLFFSKYTRKFKPYLLTDIGWSIILNKQELKNNYIYHNPNAANLATITSFNGIYIKPGLGIDYSFKNNSIFIDLCFNMNCTSINIDKQDYNTFLTGIGDHDQFFFLFRLGYIFKF